MSNPPRNNDASALWQSATAVIFDFDGVLVDTEWAIYSSWKRVFESEGHPLPLDIFNQCLGSGYTHWNPADHLEKLTGHTYDWPAITAKRQEELVAELLGSGLMPGARELLEDARRRGIPLAVASSSSHHWVDGWLEKLDARDYFRAVVCRDDNLPVKPDPALFLEAARRIDMSPAECLVIEDSQNGVLAASRAAMDVIAVPNRVTANADFSPANVRVASLADIL